MPILRAPILHPRAIDTLLTATAVGTFRAAVPSGASTGIHEALELRDGVCA